MFESFYCSFSSLVFIFLEFKNTWILAPPDPGFHQPHYSDVDNDEHCIEWERFDEVVAEAEQVEPSNTCPFIDWEALESIDDDDDENFHGSASINDVSASANKRCKLVLYSDSSDSDN